MNEQEKKSLHVVIVSPAHPLRGGIAASTERFAYALQAQGYKVTIFSFKLQYPNFLFPGKTQFSDDSPPKDLEIHTEINSISPLNWLLVGLKIRRLKADIVFARYWLPFMGPSIGTILRIAKWNSNTKTLALADNVIPHEKRPGDRFFTKYFIGAVDGFLVMSRSVKSDIQQFSPNKPVVYSPHPLYDGYGERISKDKAREKLGLSPSKNYLLFFGFIRDYKGLDLLLEALGSEHLKDEPIHLIIAGEYYGKQEYYESLIEAYQLQDRLVLHTRFISNEAVKYYFGAADLVVQPYRTATQSGISQIAYHFEVPMVVTEVGGLPEIVPDGEVGYVTQVDSAAIAKAIRTFFKENKSAAFIQGIQKRKHLYSWKKMTEAFSTLFHTISAPNQ